MKEQQRLILSQIILWLVCLPAMTIVDFVPEWLGNKIWDFTIWTASGFNR